MNCPKCGCEKTTKNGFHHGKQRFKCKDCQYQFTKEDRGKIPAEHRAQAIYLYITGLSLCSIARQFDVAPSTVLYWVKNFALKTYEKPQPTGTITFEIDEMWHFIKKNKKSGSGKPIAAIPVSWLTGKSETEVQKL